MPSNSPYDKHSAIKNFLLQDEEFISLSPNGEVSSIDDFSSLDAGDFMDGIIDENLIIIDEYELGDVNFSDFSDNFSEAIGKVSKKMRSVKTKKKIKKRRSGEIKNIIVPEDRSIIIEGISDYGEREKPIQNKKQETRNKPSFENQEIRNVIVPEDRSIIIEGVNEQGGREIKQRDKSNNADFVRRGEQLPKNRILTKKIPIKKSATIYGRETDTKTTKRILVPDDRKLIIEGVEKFIVSDSSIKKIGYYKGKKLKQLMLHINNTESALDFTIELFNTAAVQDYEYSTGLQLNDKITVAGGTGMSYSELINYLIGNPTMIPNATIVFTGSTVSVQQSQTMQFLNKNVAGWKTSYPMQPFLLLDVNQFQNDIVYFDVDKDLNRPFIPDGSETIQYTVKAGNSVSICFYYKQHQLKKFFFKEARNSKHTL